MQLNKLLHSMPKSSGLAKLPQLNRQTVRSTPDFYTIERKTPEISMGTKRGTSPRSVKPLGGLDYLI